MLCDISGSMEPYARAYLQFLTCAAGSGPNAEAFVFATRLTRLTRALASRHPERAIQRAAAAAPDWSSGTRIGDALKAFNDRHGRRGMARGAVVVILSDGWERGDPQLVGREMERLARLAHRIVWVNPRVGASAFSVQAGGMVAALPHCDALVSGHSFARARRGRRRDRGAVDAPPARAAAPPRPPSRSRAVGQRHAGAGQLGGDAQRARPEPGQDDAGMGERMTERPSEDLHLPGLRAAGGAAASAGRPAARLLRPGGAQRAERPSGARAPRGRDRARPRGERVVADEAYRAVFLRVHPTGKMVLSLTTDVRRQGARVRAARRRASSASRRSTSRSSPRTPTASASATASTRARPAATPAAIASATAKIRDKARLLAGMALDAAPETLTWSNGAWVAGDGSDPAQVKTVEDIALYAHGTGALPPGVEGGLDAQTVYRD